jgi:hypothetical protein
MVIPQIIYKSTACDIYFVNICQEELLYGEIKVTGQYHWAYAYRNDSRRIEGVEPYALRSSNYSTGLSVGHTLVRGRHCHCAVAQPVGACVAGADYAYRVGGDCVGVG